MVGRLDIMSCVMLGGFRSQCEASCVSSNHEELWYNETVCLWMTIYIYIYIYMCVCVCPHTHNTCARTCAWVLYDFILWLRLALRLSVHYLVNISGRRLLRMCQFLFTSNVCFLFVGFFVFVFCFCFCFFFFFCLFGFFCVFLPSPFLFLRSKERKKERKKDATNFRIKSIHYKSFSDCCPTIKEVDVAIKLLYKHINNFAKRVTHLWKNIKTRLKPIDSSRCN